MKKKVPVCTQNLGEGEIERDWAEQWGGMDPFVKAQFATVVDWHERTHVLWITKHLNWETIKKAIGDAALKAKEGGVIIVVTGHGAADAVDLSVGVINFDPTEHQGTAGLSWQPGNEHLGTVGRGVFIDKWITPSEYLREIPVPHDPQKNTTQKIMDEEAIHKKTKGWHVPKMRHDAFDALQVVGQNLRSHRVGRLTFTNCTAGKATVFMDELARWWQTEVACFKVRTMIFDDAKLGQNPGKARLILASDYRGKDFDGTNTPRARVFSPNLDDLSIAYVGGKRS